MDSRFQPKFKYTWNDPQFLTKYIPLPSAPPPKKSITLESDDILSRIDALFDCSLD